MADMRKLQERQEWADANMDEESADAFDPVEDAMGECGLTDDGFCMLAGTEYCDFDCPFRDEWGGEEDDDD